MVSPEKKSLYLVPHWYKIVTLTLSEVDYSRSNIQKSNRHLSKDALETAASFCEVYNFKFKKKSFNVI